MDDQPTGAKIVEGWTRNLFDRAYIKKVMPCSRRVVIVNAHPILALQLVGFF
jgi:hypothetical protein